MHFKSKLIALIFLFILIENLSAQKERGSKIFNMPNLKGIYDNQENWAILIGINEFLFLPKLNYAVADAEEVKDLLNKEYGFKNDHIILISDKQATLQRIRQVLGDELPQEVSKNDCVLIFWAGHGHTIDSPTGEEMGYLIPHDGNDKKPYSTCLSMSEINNFSKLIPAKHIFFIVDACFSGLAADQRRGNTKDNIKGHLDYKQYFKTITNVGVRQIITAGGRGETVIESSRWGHSAFTYLLIKCLKEKKADYDDDGVITATELAAYLKPSVFKLTEGRQNPQYRVLDGEGEYVFIPEKFIKSTRPSPIDNIPPQISNRTIDRTKEKKSFLIQAEVSDNMSDIASVLLAYRTNNTDGWEKVFMRHKNDGIYEYNIPESQVKSPVITYYFAAGDKAGNKNVLSESKNVPFMTFVDVTPMWKKLGKIVIPSAAGFFIGYLIYRNIPGTIEISVDGN